MSKSVASVDKLLIVVNQLYSLRLQKLYLLQASWNDVYKGESETGILFIIKVHNKNSTIKVDPFVNDFVEQKFIKSSSNRFTEQIEMPEGKRLITVSNYIRGRSINHSNEHFSFSYGQKLAQLHTSAPISVKSISESPLIFVESADGALNFRCDIITAKVSLIVEYVKQALLDNANVMLEFGLCHGDCHGGNALVTNQNAIKLIDHEFSGLSFLNYDIALLKWARFIDLSLSDTQLNNIYRGYCSIKTLNTVPHETELLFMCIKELVFLSQQVEKQEYFGINFIKNKHVEYRINLLLNYIQQL